MRWWAGMSGPVRICHYPHRDGPLPEGAHWVGRPSRWGNPYKVGQLHVLGRDICVGADGTMETRLTLMQVLENYRHIAELRNHADPAWLAPLADATALACACPLDQPCHADILIDLLRGVS